MSNNPDIIFTGHVRNGKRIYHKPILVEKIIEQLEGQQFEEVIKKKEKGKSHSQLAYYFGGIVKKTCMECTLFEGWTEKEIDAFFRQEFIGYVATKVIDGKQENFLVAEHLSNLTVAEMANFIDRVTQWLAEHEIYVLTPDEFKLNKYQILVKEDTGDDW